MKNESQDIIERYMRRVRTRRILKLLWRFVKYTFMTLLFLIIFAWILLQNEGVQNWVVQRVATYLSGQMHTKVELERVSFSLFDQLTLEKFYVEDLQGDTLIYSQYLNTSLSANLLGILRNNIDVDDIQLEGAKVRLIRKAGAERSNLLEVLANLSKNKKKKKKTTSLKRPLILDVDNIDLTNVQFIQIDSVKGNHFDVFVPSGKIKVESLDLPELNFVVEAIELNQPRISLSQIEKFPASIDLDTTLQSIEKDSLAPTLDIALHRLNLEGGTFTLDDFKNAPKGHPVDSILNLKHLVLEKLNIAIDSFSMGEKNYQAQIKNISFTTPSGFVLEELSADQFTMTDRKTELSGFLLQTPKTIIKDNFSLKYRQKEDLKDFGEKVLIQADFKNSRIWLQDVLTFLPGLSKNAFFRNNQNEVLALNGTLSGRVNNLRGRNLDIRLGKGLIFRGSFSSRNLTKRTEESLNLKVERLYADVKTLRQLIPNFSPPSNFDKLGQLDFSGRFDGFFIDFVAYGNLKTELGVAAMDMRMDLRRGRTFAKYSGNLSLTDFDLGRWSNNQDLGTITFNSTVSDGIGLTLEVANANLGANVNQFTYKGYTYENLVIEGTLNKNQFDGKLNIKDDNIDFQFDGLIDNSGTAPDFNFKAAINHMDLKALNLSKKNYVASGSVDLRLQDINPETFTGTALLKDIRLIQDDTINYQLDSVYLTAKNYLDSMRSLRLYSEVINAELEGLFRPVQVVPAIAAYLVTNFPEFSEKANIRAKRDTIPDQQFKFSVKIINTKNLTQLFAPQLDTLKDISISGDFDNIENWANFEFEIPELRYNNVLVKSVYGKVAAQENTSNYELGVYHTRINETRHFQPIYINGGLDRDTIDFNISATNFTKEVDDLNLGGKIYLFEDFFELNLASTALIILQDKWQIQKNNYLRFKKNHIDIRNLQLTDGKRKIRVASTSSKGLTAEVNGFDLSVIDSLWRYKEMDFTGGFNLKVKADDIFKLEGLEIKVSADTFQVNQDIWGALKLEAFAQSLKEPVEAGFTIGNEIQRMVVDGYVNLPGGKRTEQKPRSFGVEADIKNYPLSIAEYWIGGGVTDTRGRFDGQVKISAGEKDPFDIKGEVQIRDLEVTINYLQTRYKTKSGRMKVNNNYLFDVSGNYIYDKYGNAAAISGGIRHTFLKKMRLDATISADNFLCMDTKKGDNDLFYGHAMGTGIVLFSGPFNKANIDIDVRSEPNTEINIPLEDKKSASEVKFIKYIDKTQDTVLTLDQEKGLDIKGIALNMNIEVTPDAKVRMIFDESAGDVMEGQGNGDLQMRLTREGNFTMNGDYTISQGNYLFTLYNFVNKPFTVKEGGVIRWTGDPLNAQIDVEAEYKVRSNIYNFIIEYLNDNTIAAARNPTDINLTMKLDGILSKPNINFSVEFPNLIGELRNYTESKIRQLEQDPNELNRQVFGLLVFGSFLPSSQQGLEGADSFLGGLNTVSEFISNQLSLYISELFSEVVTDVDFISGINFNVDYNIYQANDIRTATTQRGSNLAFGVELDLDKILDRRLTLSVGTDIDWGGVYSNTNTGAYFAGEYTLEYALTKDGRFKVRFYHQINNDQNTLDGRKNKFGLGFSYRKEFDNFSDFFKSMRKVAREEIDQRLGN